MDDFSGFAKTIVDRFSQVSGHNSKDWEVLAAAKAQTLPWAAPIAKEALGLLYTNPGTAPIMASYNRADRELSLAVWLERLMSGAPGQAFWAETALVGYVHAMLGIDNGSILSLATLIQDRFLTKVMAELPAAEAVEVLRAFKRTFEVAMAVMVSAYDHAVMTGVTQIGFNERLLQRMRGVAIKKMVDDGRSALPLLDWNDALSVNIKEIDSQHKVLIEILNALHSSSSNNKDQDALKKILRDLTDYTIIHFAFEEKLFDGHGFPESAKHKESHERLTAQVLHFGEEVHSGKGRVSAEVFMFLRSWLNGHIRGSDKVYAKYLNERGVY